MPVTAGARPKDGSQEHTQFPDVGGGGPTASAIVITASKACVSRKLEQRLKPSNLMWDMAHPASQNSVFRNCISAL